MICAVLAAASAIGAILYQRNSSTPIGEGEVFLHDAAVASAIFEAGSEDQENSIRQIRNDLDVESVSLVDTQAFIVVSTSGNTTGGVISNPVLSFGAFDGRFVAIAAAIDVPIFIDGVEEWLPGEFLYQVLSPLGNGQSLLIQYDISDLLARRAQPGELQTETIELLVLASVFITLGIAVFIGHSRATARHEQVVRETEILKAHTVQLEATNEELDEARTDAEKALALAEEKIRIRSEFVLMINHELRTPLTSVVTGAEILQGIDMSESERSDVLRAMVADGSRLQEIIDQILAVARIENRGLTYVLRETPIAEACGAAVRAHPAAVSGFVEHPHESEVFVRTDVRTISLVVGSLVDNALSHGASRVVVGCTTQRTLDPYIEVGSSPKAAAYITVADDGPGIPKEFLPRVFEKFEKSSESSGTGLGLYMARLMVEGLDGSLGVNTSSTGTVFTLALPSIRKPQRLEARL